MEKIINMRELGGLINQQGQMVRKGKLFRAGNPSVASIADTEQLKNLNLTEIIDFRSSVEKRVAEQVFAVQFNWVAQPIFTGDITALLSSSLSKVQAVSYMCDIYKRFVRDFQQQFHYLLKQAEQGKILLYHCTAGKDRTGFASFLLLNALGVADDFIMADYLLSNQAVAALKYQLVDFIASDLINADALNAILEVDIGYLESAIAIINKEHGNVQSYLKNTLAVDIKAIRHHYLED